MAKFAAFALLFALTVVVLLLTGRAQVPPGGRWPGARPSDLAGSRAHADATLACWRGRPGFIDAARAALRWDFLLIACYTATTVWACAWAGSVFAARGMPVAAALRPVAVGAVIGAALLDVFEDVALLSVLNGAAGAFWPRAARVAKVALFVLLGLAALYSIAGAAFWAWARVRPAAPQG